MRRAQCVMTVPYVVSDAVIGVQICFVYFGLNVRVACFKCILIFYNVAAWMGGAVYGVCI